MARRKTAKQDGQMPTRDVNAAARALVALQLRRTGLGWVAVAEQAGYSDPGAAFRAVQRELDRNLRGECDRYRQEETDRLDALLTVYWPKAMSGDGWSMDRVLRLMERRAALLGLDAKGDAMAGAAQTLIRQYAANVEAV